MAKKKTTRQLDADIKTSLAERARAKGFEPETIEGGRAMMQSLTFEDIAAQALGGKLKKRWPRLENGSSVPVELRFVGGTQKVTAIVNWDYGNDVDVALPGYGNRRAKRSADGTLHVYP